MRVAALLTAEYEQDGWTNKQATIAEPLWSDIESAIRTLDKFRRPSVRLLLDPQQDDMECMDVMGGEGAYWVAVTAGPHDQKRLFDPEKPSDEVELWTSDQGYSDHAFHVCDLETVLRAARYFADNGDCDPGLQWEF
jgi:hypothetical protein